MGTPVRILHLEDNRSDAELVRAMLAEEDLVCEIVCVASRGEFASALEQGGFHLIISDFTIPSYDGRSALNLARAKCPDVPFLFFSGTIGEEAAIDALTAGAIDYVLKQRAARLVPAVRRALRETEERIARKRVEEKLSLRNAALEATVDGIVITDRTGAIVWVNQAFTVLTGYSAEEVLGQNPRMFKSGIQDPSFYADLWSTITSGRSWNGEIFNKRKNGSIYTEEQTITPVRGTQGEISHFIAIKRDITERKSLEDQFRQSQKMEAIGRLAGGVAHDFNNMLTIISGYTQMILKDLGPDHPLTPSAREIKKAAERSSALTRQLLAFSRRQVLQPKILDLNAVVTNVQSMLRHVIGEDITLRSVLSPGLGRVKVDPGQIEQVLMNLVVNARDAMPQGGTLTVETANVELDDAYALRHVPVIPGRYVQLTVSDTGCGMDRETQARIFDPFFTTKEPDKGTGLGLSTVYGIVKQSDGYIWVYSEPGQGATFKIYLPRTEESAETVEPNVNHDQTPGGSETILLVEDESAVRALVCGVLRQEGYTVLEAGNGQEAIQLADQHQGPIHLMITDVVMPRMGGRELAEGLQSSRPAMKVLYVSGYTGDAIVHHGVLGKGMHFLEKPFMPGALTRKVREVLDANP